MDIIGVKFVINAFHDNLFFSAQVFFGSEVVNKYPLFKNHVQQFYDNRKEDWCSAFRRDTLLRGNNTNNYVEASMRILKDMVSVSHHKL